MSEINRWELSGNLGGDPESCNVNGTYNVWFRICYTDRDTGSNIWMRINCINNLARRAKKLHKGDYIAVTGKVKVFKGLYIAADDFEVLKER